MCIRDRYEPYTWAHVLTQLQLLLFSGLAFFVMLPWLKRTLTITLDTDWFWRRLGPGLVRAAAKVITAGRKGLDRSAGAAMALAWARTERRYGADSRMARTWSVSAMAGWVLVLLLGFLLMYYV